MTQRLVIAALAVVAFCAAPVLAQCQKTCEKAKTCQAKHHGQACSMDHKAHAAKPATEGEKSKSAMCSSDVTCDGDRVRFEGVSLPRIGFKVGDRLTCCMKSAQQMAEGDTSRMTFVVADKTYKDLGEAQTARLKVLEECYQDLLTVKYAVGDECVSCPMAAKDMAKASGKPVRYRVAAFDFEKKAEAEKAAEAARAAADKITMSWVVSETTFTCPKAAGEIAKSTGKKVECCVGEQKTACETTAKTRLIEARITAALEVLAKPAQG